MPSTCVSAMCCTGGPRTDQNEKEYVAAEKKKAKEEGLVDYVSTNDIITSFFLGGMDAGQMVRAGNPPRPRAPRH